ncbi:MAG: DUF1566 domain-containing protein [Planctomycetes bacterium]|nr:DUF1566 domain-containing protein [Planctomycetota bacterium]
MASGVLPAAAVAALAALALAAAGPPPDDAPPPLPYAIVDTGQDRCYDATREIAYPTAGAPLFGQDAQYAGQAPRYEDSGDGTVTDRVTGLVWQQDPGPKKTWREALDGAARCRLANRDDWRLPTIKELYSLILFSGTDPDPQSEGTRELQPFLDTRFFRFSYGDRARGERVIDSQFTSATRYVATTMHGAETAFGVNFADGRIKGYGLTDPRGGEKKFHVLYVRGNPRYGKNILVDGGDGMVTDRATGLLWMKVDSGHLKAGPAGDGRMNWPQALAWAEGLTYAGQSDWRLPSAKELQSLVDYARSPDTTGSAAIDPVFEVTPIRNEAGERDYPFYWTSTTHASLRGGAAAVYVAFGRSPGWLPDRRHGGHRLLDVHGAGSQRSDPKTGDAADYPRGRGPQGDVVRILNFVRCVRGGEATPVEKGPALRKVAASPDARSGDERGAPGQRFIRRLDRNGDGKVSRSEFDGPPERFSDFDRNGDGFITEDEAPRGPPPDRPGGRRDG